MRRKKEKDYWRQMRETFASSQAAQTRAGVLRSYEHVSRVHVSGAGNKFIVEYSVAGWFMEAMEKAGGTL